MAKTKEQKHKEVDALLEKVKDSKGGVFISYAGLNVSDLTNLRNELRQAGVSLTMIKKRLLKIVLDKSKIKSEKLDFQDKNVSLALSKNDEVSAAKILAKFAKSHENFELQAGLLEKELISGEQVMALALIPSKDELLAKLVGSLNSPMSGMVGVLSGNMRKLVYALNAISEAKS